MAVTGMEAGTALGLPPTLSAEDTCVPSAMVGVGARSLSQQSLWVLVGSCTAPLAPGPRGEGFVLPCRWHHLLPELPARLTVLPALLPTILRCLGRRIQVGLCC